MMVSHALVAVSPAAITTQGEATVLYSPLLVAFAATTALLVGGVLAGKTLQKKKKRRKVFGFLGSWWKRRQQGYIRQDDTQEESVLTEVHSYYPPPAFSSSSLSEENEEVSLASNSVYYENTPMLPPRPDEESIISEAYSYVPPPTPDVIPPSRVAKSRHYHWYDGSSFQSSLESVDSLVESYWDPDDESQLSLVPIDMNPSAVIEEHIQFLQHQTRGSAREERRDKKRAVDRVRY